MGIAVGLGLVLGFGVGWGVGVGRGVGVGVGAYSPPYTLHAVSEKSMQLKSSPRRARAPAVPGARPALAASSFMAGLRGIHSRSRQIVRTIHTVTRAWVPRLFLSASTVLIAASPTRAVTDLAVLGRRQRTSNCFLEERASRLQSATDAKASSTITGVL